METAKSISLAAILCLGFAMPGLAQDSYDSGYRRGYDAGFAGTSPPDALSDYSRGFRAGLDDSAEDEFQQERPINERLAPLGFGPMLGR
jgi:hypothetical protein